MVFLALVFFTLTHANITYHKNCSVASVVSGGGPYWESTNAPASSAGRRSFYGGIDETSCRRDVSTHDVTSALIPHCCPTRVVHTPASGGASTAELLTAGELCQFGSGTGMAFNALEEFIA